MDVLNTSGNFDSSYFSITEATSAFRFSINATQNGAVAVAEHSGRTTAWVVLGGIFLLAIIAITIVGNIVVVIAVASYHRLRDQYANLFIVNLAAADLSVALCVMLLTFMAYVWDIPAQPAASWRFGEVLCNFQCGMNYCLIVVSMMTLGFVSIDRLVHIAYPLQYHDIITLSRIHCMIIWTWIQGAAIGVTPVILHWIHYDYDEVVCAIDWNAEHTTTYVIVAFITCFVTPSVAMVACYSIILKTSSTLSTEIHRSMKKMHSHEPKECRTTSSSTMRSTNTAPVNDSNPKTLCKLSSTEEDSISSFGLNTPVLEMHIVQKVHKHKSRTSALQHKKIIQSLLVVVFIFFVCMTPFSVTKLIKVLNGKVPAWLNTLASFVQLASSAFNPLVYGIFRKEFREAFKRQYERAFLSQCLSQRKLLQSTFARSSAVCQIPQRTSKALTLKDTEHIRAAQSPNTICIYNEDFPRSSPAMV